MERLLELRKYDRVVNQIDELIELYEWFLNVVQKKKDKLYIWLTNDQNKNLAFDNAARFGDLIVEIMLMTPNQSRLKYFLV